MDKENYLDAAAARIIQSIMEEEETGHPRTIPAIHRELVQSFKNGLKAAVRRPNRQKAVR